jgi:hypothetical protein
MPGSFQKLRDAIRKATHRANARDDEAQEARHGAHRLTRELKVLNEEVERLGRQHAETMAEIAKEEGQQTPDTARLRRLHKKSADEAEEMRHLVTRIHHKNEKRKPLRKRFQEQTKKTVWWIARQTVLRKKLAAAKKKYEETHGTPAFESWMLNGCPEVSNANLKEVIAFVVVTCGQYITATTNGVHATGSFHYIEEAVDCGSGSVSNMQECAVKLREHFGRAHFLELFSPCDWWLKYGVEYPGYFPGHGDHVHAAVAK